MANVLQTTELIQIIHLKLMLQKLQLSQTHRILSVLINNRCIFQTPQLQPMSLHTLQDWCRRIKSHDEGKALESRELLACRLHEGGKEFVQSALHPSLVIESSWDGVIAVKAEGVKVEGQSQILDP
ncbi:hypothetical protein G7Y89_g13051 [Cudoniella acicularis]|uniref:Uncharacterized protein n=1 Tax=Cudoniella acicularis TaxID=354080 RepID=A0A8H4RAM8_9HELO|nr:hypothetical protein G7Y89_g13051 [Cudoniella acicularis]